MTIRERLQKLGEKEHDVRRDDTGPGEAAEMASTPARWGWDKTAWGDPMPNVVAWLDESRGGR